jgi:hypothetical protein
MHGACHASTQVFASILQSQTYILGATYLYNCLVITWRYSAFIVQTRVIFIISVYSISTFSKTTLQYSVSNVYSEYFNFHCPNNKNAINILRLTQQSTVTNWQRHSIIKFNIEIKSQFNNKLQLLYFWSLASQTTDVALLQKPYAMAALPPALVWQLWPC